MTKQKMRFYFFLSSAVILSLFLTGASCGKKISQKASEKATEKIIEKQIGGKADVDVSQGNIKVETEEGKMEAGENVKLPSDFPKDIYVIEGTIKAAISDQAREGQTISVETNKSMDEVYSLYQEKLKSDGWKITGTMAYGEVSTVVAEKDNRTASIVISKNGNKTTVALSTGKNE